MCVNTALRDMLRSATTGEANCTLTSNYSNTYPQDPQDANYGTIMKIQLAAAISDDQQCMRTVSASILQEALLIITDC
jgi:hypothetical protein